MNCSGTFIEGNIHKVPGNFIYILLNITFFWQKVTFQDNDNKVSSKEDLESCSHLNYFIEILVLNSGLSSLCFMPNFLQQSQTNGGSLCYSIINHQHQE